LSNIVERLTFDDCQHLSLGTPHPIFSLGTPGFADAPPVRAPGHALARLIAQGTPDWEAAAITGYTQSSISILKVDPTFKDLLKFYADSVDAQYVDLHSAMAGVALDAVMEIQTRLEENGDKIPIRELRELAATFADRTGHGPSSTSKVDVNVNIGAKMEEARRRIEERRKMIDVTPGE
jgi:hypothetical protein